MVNLIKTVMIPEGETLSKQFKSETCLKIKIKYILIFWILLLFTKALIHPLKWLRTLWMIIMRKQFHPNILSSH